MTGSAQITDATLPDGHGRPKAWQTVVCRRQYGPPLRFKGVRLTRHQMPLAQDSLTIDLWRRKTPGYVVCLSGLDTPDASSHASLYDAMDWLEDRCSAGDHTDPALSLATLLDRTPQQFAEQTKLRTLAGEAMDDWDRLMDAPQ